jgi:DNA-binding CsgD family transcriptional regulator
MNKVACSILVFILYPICLHSQNLLPPIQNHRIFEYNAASKNWSFSVDKIGELYVANNKGLLHFNGEEWQLNKLPNNTIMRSVAYIGDRIYSGSYEEFGFWTQNKEGLLEYTSLTHLIENHAFTSEEFWEILPYGEQIIFRSFASLYLYEDEKITVINPGMVVSDLVLYDGKVVVAGGNGELFELAGKELIPLEDHGLLADKTVNDMIVIEEGLLIGTKLHGCFLLGEEGLESWEKNINGELKAQQLNRMLFLKDGRIAFGTIKNGVYIYDSDTSSYEILNREVGLQNNTVLAMLQYREQLWIGLDNGIDRIQLNTPLSYYTDFSGVIGTVYDLAVYDEVLYLGSNTGIYYFDGNHLKFMEGSQGHVWDLKVVNGALLCGHNTGTFQIDSGKLQKISDISGGYQMVKIPETESSFLQGTYTGIAKYQKNENGSWDVIPVEGISSPVKHLCFENPTTLWIAHPYKGFSRIRLNGNKDKILQIQEFSTGSVPNNYNIKLFNIKNQIVLQSKGIWYKYDPILSRITKFEEFRAYTNKDLVYYDEDHFWFIDNEGSKEVIQTNLKESHFVLDDEQLRKRLAPEAENIIQLNDSIYLFTLIDGFGKLNLSKFQRHMEDFELPTPKLNSFMDEEKKYALSNTSFTIPNGKAQDITIKVSSASLVQPRYYYELSGEAEQSGYFTTGTIQLQNLPFGNYEINVSTVSIDNEPSSPLRMTFAIAPPWYLSKWSLMGYLVFFVGMVFLVRWWNKRKLERKHTRLKKRLQKEQEERLAHLEKDKLEKVIKLKQKELASSTMNVAKKNELILELKNLLLMNKDKFQNQQRYRSFIKKLNSSINDDGDWRHFEVNFKELHEDFFEVLLGRYPGLTPKDLKLCAYLKMNLSSKEIAPLMGITTRGVEIHRYRLRKKLRMDGSQNISNFLITLR